MSCRKYQLPVGIYSMINYRTSRKMRIREISPIGIVKMEIKTCRNPFLLDPRPVGICLKLTLHTQMRKIFGTSHCAQNAR